MPALARITRKAQIEAWTNSQDHRKYLLKRRFRDLGVGDDSGHTPRPTQIEGITLSEEGFRE